MSYVRYSTGMVVITESKPWHCLIYKRSATESETTCVRCGHRLKARKRA